MFETLISELSEEMAPFRSKVADAHLVRCALALSRQQRIAEANARIRRRQIEGVGEVVAQIDSELFWQLVAKQGANYNDPDFLAVLLRDNETLRVNCEPDRLTLRVDGLRGKLESGKSKVEIAEPDIDTAAQEIGAGEMEAA